jgi:hypothetical protein
VELQREKLQFSSFRFNAANDWHVFVSGGGKVCHGSGGIIPLRAV